MNNDIRNILGALLSKKLTKSDIMKGGPSSGWHREGVRPHIVGQTPLRRGLRQRLKRRIRRIPTATKNVLKGVLLTVATLGGAIGAKKLVDTVGSREFTSKSPVAKKRALDRATVETAKQIKEQKLSPADFMKAEKDLMDKGNYDEYLDLLEKQFGEETRGPEWGDLGGGGYHSKPIGPEY